LTADGPVSLMLAFMNNKKKILIVDDDADIRRGY
jgi:hypothetical protein